MNEKEGPLVLTESLRALLSACRQQSVCVLTGAGISAESGIPTFRGQDGYWTIGSRNYMPEEMATARLFAQRPEEVWRWYLYRFGICRSVRPNDAHRALVRLEAALGERFALVTQNIDGLHRRAGSSSARTLCIHGDAAYVRCSADCGDGLQPLPEFGRFDAQTELSEDDERRLKCTRCGAWLRPHVLWFDEYYDEENYRADSALRAAAEAELLLVIGTSGATNLPMQIGQLCLRTGAAIVDVNPEPNPFTDLAQRASRGHVVRGPASILVPEIVGALTADV
ncbi:MAG: Sir2 family NAD-dependent protein deacetylase [Polyangiaceae bacterium]